MTSQPAIGIDLGTTYSCVALYRNGKVEIIPNSSGGRTMPSCVSFNEIERLMGEPAKNQAAINPTNTIYDCKRLIGRKFNEATVQSDMKYWPFKIIDVEGHIKVQVTYRDEVMVFYPEEISSMLLMQLKKDTEAYLGEPIKDCVITVPAHFSDSQRQATKDAALLANLNVLRVINEPTAAALAYGMDKKNSRDGYILVYDLGGGTFDVSILALKNHGKTVEVKSTAGNTHLGGQDFNNRLVEFFASQIKVNHGIDIMQDKRCLQKLTIACERAKRSLSTATQTFVEIESLRDDEGYRTSISRARFEELNDDLFQETLTIVEQAIQDAGITKSEIHEVILVGGSTRIPRIQTLLRNYFDRIPINCFLNPDEAVAYGAAVEAASFQNNLADEFKELVLVDVTPLSLGIKILGNQMSVIIKKNTAIPCMKSLTYSTAYNDQTTVAVSVYEGERVTATDNILLGRFELDGITKANAGSARIKILFEIDHNGILNVTARDDTTHNEKSIKISNTSRLSPEEAERMISDAERFRAIDEQRLEYYAARHTLEQYSFNAKHTLEAHKYTADDDIKASIPVILENVNGTLKWIEEDDSDNAPEYKEALEGQKKMCDPIIQQLKK